MHGERWSQVESLFVQAAELPLTERAAFLDQACKGDDELRREIESLLDFDEPGESLVRIPTAFVTTEPGDAEPDDTMSGRRVGVYRLIRLIGHGGMGAVYLGVRDDDQFHKQVAVKLLKRGMDTDFMLGRFRQERQILAQLEHPFIARLIDGGATAEGLPYFVMEFVDGVPITQYCVGRNLSVPERLRLFRLVCEAVQYAHQNLVVHRDLKPSNILTTKEGVPKLLDFGIAKALDPGLRSGVTHTQREFRMLTPDYASPEQVKGLPISTASDTYSLGAILYELLTGQRPHKFASDSVADMEKAICESEPEKPSAAVARSPHFGPSLRNQLRRQLSGDLDNIVLTAMRIEPQRRYASAAEFSEDIRRHLEGLPVRAREDRWAYRARKFIGRNKLAAGAALVIAASLVGGIVMTTVEARRADRRFQLVRGLAHTTLFDLSDQMERLPGSTALRASTIRSVVKYLDALAQDGSPNPELDLEIATAYERAAGLEGHSFRSNLGDAAGAIANYRKALAIYERIPDRPDLRMKVFRGLIDTHLNLAQLESLLGSPDRAALSARKATSIAELLEVSGIELEPETQVNLYFRLADSEYDRGLPAGEIRYYNRAVEVAQKWSTGADSTTALAYLRDSYRSRGSAFGRAGNLSRALEEFRQALRINDELIKRTDVKQDSRFNEIATHISAGDVLSASDDPNLGDRPQALKEYEAALATATRLAAADPTNVYAQRNVATCYQRLGMYWAPEKPSLAVEQYEKSLGIIRGLNSADPRNAEYRYHTSRAYMGLGEALHNIGRDADAVVSLSSSIELQNAIAAVSPERIWNLRALSRSYRFMGNALLALGETGRAWTAFSESLSVAERMLQRAPTSLPHQLDRAEALEAIGNFHAVQMRRRGAGPAERAESRKQATACYQQALAVWQGWVTNKLAEPYSSRRERQAAAALSAIPASH